MKMTSYKSAKLRTKSLLICEYSCKIVHWQKKFVRGNERIHFHCVIEHRPTLIYRYRQIFYCSCFHEQSNLLSFSVPAAADVIVLTVTATGVRNVIM